jgi:HSP20 family protein
MKTLVKNNSTMMPEIPSVFDDFFMRDLFQLPGFARTSVVTSVPSVNIKETEKSYELEIAAPGMKREDFKVELDGQQLTISAEKKAEQETKEENYTRKEFNYSGFTRSFTLPERMVDAENISAKYTDGILYLTVPKTKEAIKPTRLIEVA